MQKPRTHRELIKALEGPVKLARDLGIDQAIPTTVHWGKRGIPSRYWHHVAELAAAKGLPLTAHDIERLPLELPAEQRSAA